MIDPTIKDAYAKRVGSLCSDCSVLTASILSDINQVFYGEGLAGDLSAIDLSVRYVTSQEYHDLVTGASGQFNPKTLYVISSDEINAHNTQIKNVADPEEDKDAANKWYVDSACESVLNIVEAGTEADLQNYYKMSETSSSSEISIALSGKQDKIDGTLCGDLSIVNGSLTIISGDIIQKNGSFAGGKESVISGNNAFSFGYQTNALSDYAFAEGYQTSALGMRSHAEGSRTTAYGYKSHVEGGGSVTNGDMTHAEGEETSALWRGGHSEGKSTTAYMYAHAEGSKTLAGYDLCASNAFVQGDTASHAEGYQTSAIARFSHAEGYQTLAGIPDANSRPIINNDPSFNGERDFRIDQTAHAEGYQTSALGKASHAAGVKANAKDDYSFVWSAISSTNKTSNGSGTFSIYPINGINGVYIDAHPLTSYIPSLDSINNKIDKKKPNCTIDDVSLISYGDQCIAKGNQSIAIGTSAYALSAKSIAYGHTITASNNYIFAFGENLSAAGKYSIVVGHDLSSSYAYSQVFGKNARSTNQKQFVWSAGGNDQNTYVPKNVGGTFNINPISGTNGFYIGNQTLSAIIANAIQPLSQKIAELELSVNTLSTRLDEAN